MAKMEIDFWCSNRKKIFIYKKQHTSLFPEVVLHCHNIPLFVSRIMLILLRYLTC